MARLTSPPTREPTAAPGAPPIPAPSAEPAFENARLYFPVTITPTIKHLAEQALTRKQLDVLKLHLAGCGTRRIATMLDISEPVAREHLRIAKLRLAHALDQETT